MTQEQIQINEVQTLRLPAIAMRGLVMFPKMVLHFDVARKKSILALNQAMQGNQKIFLAGVFLTFLIFLVFYALVYFFTARTYYRLVRW